MSSLIHAPRQFRRGFALTELLVVIAVISVLLAIGLPALSTIRDNARTVTCTSNIRQIGIALVTYEKEFRTFPPGAARAGNAQKNWLWPTFILPELDQMSLYKKLDLKKDALNQVFDDERSTNPAARYPLNTVLPFFICPSVVNLEPTRTDNHRIVDTTNQGKTLGCIDYAGIRGPGTGAGLNNPDTGLPYESDLGVLVQAGTAPRGLGPQDALPRVTTKQIRDGLGKTIMVGECPGRGREMPAGTIIDGAWAATDGDALIAIKYLINQEPLPQVAWFEDQLYSSHRAGGCNVVFSDGTVDFISESIELQVLTSLASRASGERIGKDPEYPGGWRLLPEPSGY